MKKRTQMLDLKKTTPKALSGAAKGILIDLCRKLLPLYLKRALNYLSNVIKLMIHEKKYKNKNRLREELEMNWIEFENFSAKKENKHHYNNKFRSNYHLTNGRSHEFIYRKQKELHPTKNISPKVQEEIVRLVNLAYNNGTISGTLERHSLLNLKKEYQVNGYIVLPFQLTAKEISKFKSNTRKLEYTLFTGEDKDHPRRGALPDDLNSADARMYTVLETRQGESFYPKDVENIIFLICHYLLDMSCLEVVSNSFSYSFYKQRRIWELGYDSAQNWHWDLDAIEFIKAFTYFTDVSQEDGPHQACLGTHKSKPLLIRSFYPYRIPDSIVRALYRVTSFELKAGSIILGNTKCLHRGLALKTKDSYRLMHQYYLTNPPGSFYYDLGKNYKTSRVY